MTATHYSSDEDTPVGIAAVLVIRMCTPRIT